MISNFNGKQEVEEREHICNERGPIVKRCSTSHPSLLLLIDENFLSKHLIYILYSPSHLNTSLVFCFISPVA